MATTDPQVMALVETELAETPTMGSIELFEKMKAAVPSVGALTLKQFHARYPLQVKRKAADASGTRKKRKKKRAARQAATGSGRSRRKANQGPGPRDAVRDVLMRFATELASAKTKPDVVQVLAGLDRYVDEVFAAADS